ncbi:hypothetical protein [Marinivivus vitaminiproducens]|uniref:hypothetical protein n=1 Tax=Marinivivus vitaminiproducens TaxID=3035935 RepID=UPI0027A1FBA7|nr:hypothetical protein P4R82_25230 [Geminicoccaceae bacterium SCSIO 64248]
MNPMKKAFGLVAAAALAVLAGGGWVLGVLVLWNEDGSRAEEVACGEIHVERAWARATIASRPF